MPRPDPSSDLLRWFTSDHLPNDLAGVVNNFRYLAETMFDAMPPSPEKTVGMRKLLEAKDCMVRGFIIGRDPLGIGLTKDP